MPTTMNAVLLLGHGGFEQLVYRSGVQIPAPDPDEVLVQVRAAGVNNTDVNMRIGWYSKSVTGGSRVASRRCIWFGLQRRLCRTAHRQDRVAAMRVCRKTPARCAAEEAGSDSTQFNRNRVELKKSILPSSLGDTQRSRILHRN